MGYLIANCYVTKMSLFKVLNGAIGTLNYYLISNNPFYKYTQYNNFKTDFAS